MVGTIREMLQQEPFVPFRIALTNGRTYEVANPDLVVMMPTQVFYAYPQSDRFALLRLNQVAAVETINGK